MPSSIAAALILLIVIVPGALGSKVYDSLNGIDWRERDWGAAIRYVAFSSVGLIAYVLGAALFHWWPAYHVVPESYASNALRDANLLRLAVPFVGHLAGAGLTGFAAAHASRWLARFTARTHRPGAWDVLVRDNIEHRWVVVTLASGDVLAGFLAVADAGVAAAERDLILREPARLDPKSGNYVVTPFRDLFLPASLVQNLATMAEPTDDRVAPRPGEYLWKDSDHDSQEA
jgi:hypothetical protein